MTISIVLPTYNRAHLLARAIDSVLSQTYSDIELLICDDGSTDETRRVACEAAENDHRVQYIQLEHGGANAARNAGIARANGDLLAFQDSDDTWKPNFLSRAAGVLAESGVDVVFTSHTLHTSGRPPSTVPSDQIRDPAKTLLYKNVASTQTVLCRRDALPRIEPFDSRLRRFQDWDLWLSLLSSGRTFLHVHEPLVVIERQADSISSGSARVRRRSLLLITRKHWRLLLRSPRSLLKLAVRIAMPAWVVARIG